MQIRSKAQSQTITLPDGRTFTATREGTKVPESMEAAIRAALSYLPGLVEVGAAKPAAASPATKVKEERHG